MVKQSLYLESRRDFYKQLLERPNSLSDFLPYDEYLEESRVLVLKDGSIGSVFKVGLIPHESLTEQGVLKIVGEIHRWFRMPENMVLQFHYENSLLSSKDDEISDLNKFDQGGHRVSSMLFQKKVDRLVEASSNPEHPMRPMERSLHLSIRYFPDGIRKGIKSKGDHRELAIEKQKFTDNLRVFLHHLRNLCDRHGVMKISQLNIDEIAYQLRSFFNPKSIMERQFARVNPSVSLSQQLIYNTISLTHGAVEREGVKTRTFALKCPPLYSYPAGMAQFVSLTFPFRIGINISFPETGKVKRFLATKEFFLENAISAKSRVQLGEVRQIQEDLAHDDRCLQMTLIVTVEGETEEELSEKGRQICQVFSNDLECDLIQENHIGSGLCLGSLPLNYTPDADLSTKRAISILRSDIANLIPVFDSCQSLGEGTSIHLSRENSLVPFSLLANATSNHTVVSADTGSGKSAFIIDYITMAKKQALEPIVFVIDKKSSYGMVSRYFDAEITVFDRDEDIPFSPFRGHYNEEKVAFLTKMISMAIGLTSPNFVLESEHQTAITEAIKQAYVKKEEVSGLEFVDGELVDGPKGDVSIGMIDVVAELGSLTGDRSPKVKEMIQELTSKLRPFYGDGIYAKFFKAGKTRNSESNLFYIYDLDALDGDTVLQSLMTMAVTEEIRNILSLPENQGRTGFLVLEEFAMLGRNNPSFRDFAIDFAETMRKRGCWLITLTPRPENYFNLEVGRAFWSVADNFVFLAMNPDNVDFFTKNSALFDEANTEIIKSLKTKPGEYAEVFYMNKNKSRQGAFRFYQTDYDRWMSPTNAKDSLKALQALDKYPDKWQALEYLVRFGRKGGDE